jgi:hypothetical protein
MEITSENIVPYSNRKISFSLFKKNYTLFFFRVINTQTKCNGIYFESNKNLANRTDQILIKTNYIYKIKQNNKIRLGRITREQTIQKIS